MDRRGPEGHQSLDPHASRVLREKLRRRTQVIERLTLELAHQMRAGEVIGKRCLELLRQYGVQRETKNAAQSGAEANVSDMRPEVVPARPERVTVSVRSSSSTSQNTGGCRCGCENPKACRQDAALAC